MQDRLVTDSLFRWRKTSEEVPFYKEFGHSNEVIGINELRIRSIYQYIRGDWTLHDGIERVHTMPPIYWHYLPQRPTQKEIDNESSNTTSSI